MDITSTSSSASPGLPEGGTVLVVDDDALIRMDVAWRLRESGFDVLEAEDALQAIAILNAEPAVELVFSDVQMPGALDGFGLARWVKDHRPETPVILASGALRAQAAAEALCDAAAFLEKPYLDGEVIEAARRVLAARGSRTRH